ncbi:MAG: SGNH/GDSL hydrolase family protein [Nocardioides sp.]
MNRPVTFAFRTTAGISAAAAGFVVGAQWVLRRQAAHARAIIGDPHGEVAPDSDRTYKKRRGTPLNLLVIGDSIAAGLGSDSGSGTLGARLARYVSKATGRAVTLRTAAVVGSETWQLADQLDGLPPGYSADVAIIVVGGNDVTHRIPVAESIRHLAEAIDRLRANGTEVVVGTCPDLGALPALQQPLRSLASRASRQLAAAQRRTAVERGAHAVTLATVAGPFFVANPHEMFSVDQFHPSAQGYKHVAKALTPSVLVALGYADQLPFGHTSPESA